MSPPLCMLLIMLTFDQPRHIHKSTTLVLHYVLCLKVFFFWVSLDSASNLKHSNTEAPIWMVIDHNNIPWACSPNLLQTALPEFGDAVGSCALPTINTPTSTTAELGHSTTLPSLQANTNLPTHMAPNKAVDQDYFPGFRFMNTGDIDDSLPARSPSPELLQVVSPVNLATCSCDPPGNGIMSMGICCWSCNVYNSITIPMSSGSCEVCLLFFLLLPLIHSIIHV